MKFHIDAQDIVKCPNVHIAIDIEERPAGNAVITMVCTQKRRDNTYEIFHQDMFATPE